MYTRATLRKTLGSIPLIDVRGPWVRCVAYEYLIGPPPGAPAGSGPDPLWPGGSKIHGQRFTPKGSFDCVYLTSGADTALLEVSAVFRGAAELRPRGANPQVMVTVEGHIRAVLDATEATVQAALGMTVAELTGPWAYVPGGGLAPTQLLGQVAYESGRIHGILYTSSKNPPATCLCVFPDRLDPTHEVLRVVDGSGHLLTVLP